MKEGPFLPSSETEDESNPAIRRMTKVRRKKKRRSTRRARLGFCELVPKLGKEVVFFFQ